ncbi:MAG: hypothetical protein QXT26_05255 [Thermoproteota archaeon]
MNSEDENEGETFYSKRLLQATVSEDVVRAIKNILEIERAEAERSDRAKPSLSATVEMLLRKGIKTYHAERGREGFSVKSF